MSIKIRKTWVMLIIAGMILFAFAFKIQSFELKGLALLIIGGALSSGFGGVIVRVLRRKNQKRYW